MDYTNTSNADVAVGGGIAAVSMFFYFALIVLILVAMWKIFSKAGQEGWKSIIPIYNFIVLLEIVGKPTWWVIWMFIPFANFVVFIITTIELAKTFGKGAGYMIGLIFLPIVFYPMLAFGSATYTKPQAPATQA